MDRLKIFSTANLRLADQGSQAEKGMGIKSMKALLTSAGLETEEIQSYFMSLLSKDVTLVKALFIPAAAIDADAIAVLPKCMNDLLKCGIKKENIKVYDLHTGMSFDELLQYDVVYLCGGNTRYLLSRINETDFDKVLKKYMQDDKIVLGVSAGSIIFANNHPENLGLINTKLDVHCAEGDKTGKVDYPIKDNIRLTDATALVIRDFPNSIEIIG